MMRYYVLLGFVMLFDIFVLGFACFLVFSFPTNLFRWGVAVIVVYAWQKNRGFGAWRPSNVKKLLENARKQGL